MSDAVTVAANYRRPGVYVEWLDANPQYLEIGRTDVAGFVGVAERGPIQRATKIESARQFLTTFGDAIPHGYLKLAVDGFFANGGRTCWVVRAANPDGAMAARIRLLLDDRPPFVVRATSPGAWGNTVVIRPVWGRDRIDSLTATDSGGRSQTLSPDPAPTCFPKGARVYTNLLGVTDSELTEWPQASIVERLEDDPSVPTVQVGAGTQEVRLVGGVDGMGDLIPDHFVGKSDGDAPGTMSAAGPDSTEDPKDSKNWGMRGLESVDGISFVAVPDLMMEKDLAPTDPHNGEMAFTQDGIRNAQIQIIASCMRRRDRVAILDIPRGDRNAAITFTYGFPESSFTAFYHPWIVVDDPLQLRGQVRAIPPSGHIAGMYARTDRLRGVHKPPANEVLEGVWDLSERIDDDAHADLNDNAINAIRAISGRGILVLGARTRDPDLRWRYVNVRRLMAMIEEALEEQMEWLTFEPNNPRLWKEIDRAVRGFLEGLYRAGMLDGATADDAYFVTCDESTNPTPETDEGRVTCVIGIRPPFPAEFIVVRIGITRSGIKVEEKGTQDG